MRNLQDLELLFWGPKASEGLFQLVDVHLQFFIYLPERTWQQEEEACRDFSLLQLLSISYAAAADTKSGSQFKAW